MAQKVLLMVFPHLSQLAMFKKKLLFHVILSKQRDFPHGSVVKNTPANAEDTGLMPGSGRFPGEGNDNPLQYFCLEIPWTEESGRLQSMGSQRVRLNLVAKQNKN